MHLVRRLANYIKYVLNNMIQVLAIHGLGEEALPQFHSMKRTCIQPYDISFSGVLYYYQLLAVQG